MKWNDDSGQHDDMIITSIIYKNDNAFHKEIFCLNKTIVQSLLYKILYSFLRFITDTKQETEKNLITFNVNLRFHYLLNKLT